MGVRTLSGLHHRVISTRGGWATICLAMTRNRADVGVMRNATPAPAQRREVLVHRLAKQPREEPRARIFIAPSTLGSMRTRM